MSGQSVGISIFTLPLFLRNLHLRTAAVQKNRALSTLCHSSSRAVPQAGILDTPSRGCALDRIRRPSCRSHSTKSPSPRSPQTEPRPPKNIDKLEEMADTARPRKREKREKPDLWAIQKNALKEKFPDGWQPRKRLSPDAMEGVRHLHKIDPGKFTTPVLAEHFKVSPEAIRRILRSKWLPSEEELEGKRVRWERREARVWNQLQELGLRPERKAFQQLSDVNILNEKSGRRKPTTPESKEAD